MPSAAILIGVVFTARALLAVCVIPPWQQPDEPVHLSSLRLFWSSEEGIWSANADALVAADAHGLDDPTEQAIIRSMYRHGWWYHYGRPAPDLLPTSFQEVRGMENELAGGPTTYYRVAASLFRAAGVDRLEYQFYGLRLLSVLLALATLACSWAAARTVFDMRAAAVITTLLALHPQFVLVATAASPDMAVVLFGAIAWWCAVQLLEGSRLAGPLAGIWLAAAGAVLTRRMGVPLVAAAVVMTCVVLGRAVFYRRSELRTAIPLLLATMVLLAAAAAVFPSELTRIWRAADNLLFLRERLGHVELLSFSDVLFDSSWMMAGWMRYPAPQGWLLSLRIVAVLAAIGLVVAFWRAHQHRFTLAVALIFVAIQTAAVFASVFQGPQGRYLFPVIVPLLLLWWIGLRAWFPRRLMPAADLLLVTLMFAFDLSCWSRVLIPTYVG